jgi:pantoate--beta-alanine ligase
VELFDGISSVRQYVGQRKREGKRIVLVPTMGALHDGHGACIRAGRSVENGALVVSIFVNPTQFGPGEDLGRYPRTMDADLALCREWGVDAVFAPGADEIYPSKQRSWVEVEALTEPLCGRGRPGHFRGVATVVAKLFNIVQPDVAVFGQKDAQQALVIREMTRQLDMPVELALAPTAREANGLARSSRNRYLTAEQRPKAAAVHRALRGAVERVAAGERDPASLAASVVRDIINGGFDSVEYAEVLGAADLSPLASVEGKVILAVAARLGPTRLIDNVVFRVGPDGSVGEETLF